MFFFGADNWTCLYDAIIYLGVADKVKCLTGTLVQSTKVLVSLKETCVQKHTQVQLHKKRYLLRYHFGADNWT